MTINKPSMGRLSGAVLAFALTALAPPTNLAAQSDQHDFSQDQVVAGGLSDVDKRRLLDLDWSAARFDVPTQAPVEVIARTRFGFENVILRIPAGTVVFHPDPLDGPAVVAQCGNTTCWRWLVDAPHVDITASEMARLAHLPPPGPPTDPVVQFVSIDYPARSGQLGYVYPQSVIRDLANLTGYTGRPRMTIDLGPSTPASMPISLGIQGVVGDLVYYFVGLDAAPTPTPLGLLMLDLNNHVFLGPGTIDPEGYSQLSVVAPTAVLASPQDLGFQAVLVDPLYARPALSEPAYISISNGSSDTAIAAYGTESNDTPWGPGSAVNFDGIVVLPNVAAGKIIQLILNVHDQLGNRSERVAGQTTSTGGEIRIRLRGRLVYPDYVTVKIICPDGSFEVIRLRIPASSGPN